MRFFFICWIIAFILTIIALNLGTAGAITDRVQKFELKNGLVILTMEDHTLPIISYLTFYRTGSRYEVPSNAGISHLFEHLMFKGTEHYPAGEFDRVLESNGGYSNAYTTEDMTVYYENFPKELLKKVVTMEAERMSRLSLTPANLDSERSVVLEERKLTVDNSPEGNMFEELLTLAFKAHTYQSPVIGWESSLAGLTLEDCKNYYRTFYAPNNAFVVVVGDFASDELMKLINHHYETVPAQSLDLPKIPGEPQQTGIRKSTLNLNAQLPALLLAFHVPEATHNDVWALDLIQMILATGESSRLYRLLIYEKQLATTVYAGFPWHADPYVFSIYVQVKTPDQVEYAEKLVFDQLEKLIVQGVSQEELQKGKNILRMELTRQMETFEGRGEQIGLSWFFFGVFDNISFMIDHYKQVTAEKILDVAGKYFTRDNASAVHLYPKQAKQK